ncbi:MAG: type VI secretion system tip protein VgrG [Pyrinomonadaceae bacterium]|nr:type VI secretion system tip protein VgrG [Pyrinomonadaceae bacterium]
MATTQENRSLSIATPLGKDFLLLNEFFATEGISELFSCEVELLHEEDEAGHKPTDIDVTSILGQAVTISITQSDGTSRTLSGIVNSFSRGNRTTRFSCYHATIVPHVWLLTQISQSRIFQQKSVPDILNEVFKGFEVTYEIRGEFERRNYCVQYQETDFDFASRLMEEEGIYYYFVHADGSHKMIIANTPQSHKDVPVKSEIDYSVEVSDEEGFVGSIRDLWVDCRLQTGKYTLWDYTFQLPTNKLSVEQPSFFKVGENRKLENYEYPAGYARKYDGIDRAGGEVPDDLQKVFKDNQRTVENRMKALDSQYKTLSGSSDCASLTAGHKYSLLKHPNPEMNAQYLVTTIDYKAKQSPDYISDEDQGDTYSSSFTCIPYGAGAPDYCPPRKTQKPIVYGTQTALVVGPGGEEIFTDKFGRVKVLFRWDRHGQANEGSSCWIRVAQSWAGNRWGMMFIPRVGMEVIVSFEEGDPDRPIIAGCVYNPETMPPYELPDEKTKAMIKSDSSKGGKGFNEIRFEDEKGSEQVFIHGEKNLDTRVKNDSLSFIGKDRHLTIENNQHEKVKRDKHIDVGGDRNEKVTGSVSLKVDSDVQEKVGQKYGLDAGMEVHIKSGMNLVVESGTNLTLKVGGNFVNINPGGVFIKGTMVMINSGGAAGSGAGANPDLPKAPKEADHADPGMRTEPPKPEKPPKRPTFESPAAIVMVNAAESGIPFCEICSRQKH